MTFVGDQFMGIVTLTVVCCLYFIIEGNAKFQLEVSENKDLNFFPSEFMNLLFFSQEF